MKYTVKLTHLLLYYYHLLYFSFSDIVSNVVHGSRRYDKVALSYKKRLHNLTTTSAFSTKHKQAVQVNELLKFISESGNFDQPQDEHPYLNLLDNSYDY